MTSALDQTNNIFLSIMKHVHTDDCFVSQFFSFEIIGRLQHLLMHISVFAFIALY